MDKFVKNFIRASLIYLLIGSTLGIVMASFPFWVSILTSAHVHLNLVGWISMMIFGVGYHVLPRFSGKQLYSPKLANTQFWISNIGLIGMAIFFVIRGILVYQGAEVMSINIARGFLATFGLLVFISFILFIINMFKTIK